MFVGYSTSVYNWARDIVWCVISVCDVVVCFSEWSRIEETEGGFQAIFIVKWIYVKNCIFSRGSWRQCAFKTGWGNQLLFSVYAVLVLKTNLFQFYVLLLACFVWHYLHLQTQR